MYVTWNTHCCISFNIFRKNEITIMHVYVKLKYSGSSTIKNTVPWTGSVDTISK